MAVKINCYQGKHENYGVQRVFGSFGWGIFTVVAGYLVDTYSQVARSISREHYYENKYPFMPKRVLYCRNIKIFLIFSSKLIKKSSEDIGLLDGPCCRCERHMCRGIPLFLLPCGVNILGILSWSMRPSHLSLLLLISIDTGTVSVVSCRSLLDIWLGQKTLRILRRQLLLKASSLLISLPMSLQHSDPYSSTESTLLLYNLTFSLQLIWLDLHIFWSILNAVRALGILATMLHTYKCVNPTRALRARKTTLLPSSWWLVSWC